MTLYKSNFPDGFSSSATPSIVSMLSNEVEQFVIDSTIIANGYVDLVHTPTHPSATTLDWEGVAQYYTVDFTVSGVRVAFSPPFLAQLAVGHIIKVAYQQG